MNVSVDIKGIKATTDYLKGTDRQIALATTRAIRSTLKWCKTRIKKDISSALKIQQNKIDHRLRTSNIKNGDTRCVLWAGTWNLSPYVKGKPRQIGAKSIGGKKARSRFGGVALGPSRFYRGAFLGRIFGSKENIWIRVSSRYFHPDLYPSKKYRPGDRGLAEFHGRLPVVKASIVTGEIMERVFDRDADAIRAEFDKRLRKEVNFAVNIEKPRTR